MHARKSLLFCDGDLWMKKSGAEFDVTMGSFDGAEVCELVGLYLLHHLAKIFGKEAVGLYRDDGLAILRNASGPDAERVRKKVTQFFQHHQLKVTADTNLIQTDFLDVTLNLCTGRYWPYRKPNDQPLYINVQSNHPPSITKKLPYMIVKRISEISYDVDAFSSLLPAYEETLKQSGHKIQPLPFDRAVEKNKRRQRRRKVIWFNPPYNNRVSTNIGKAFFHLLRKHFPPSNRLHKICNKNVVKPSYSCTPNMADILSAHNKKLLKSHNGKPEFKPCNCRYKPSCPLNGNCRDKAIVYQATVQAKDQSKNYIGLCETEFKARFYNHNHSFNSNSKRNATELSKFIWSCKDSGINPTISWKIICHATPYQHGGKVCNLCLAEKYEILTANDDALLNKRTELINKCRHKNKYKLINAKLKL